jgi:hypothetical protein
VVSQNGGVALVLGPDKLTVALTPVDTNTFAGVFFAESPKDRTAVTFTIADGRATSVDIGDGDGPGTGQLTRRGSRHRGHHGRG